MTVETATRPKSLRGSGSTTPPRRYQLTDEFFKDAINEAVFASLTSPVSLGERHDVRLRPNFDTACWAYLPPHKIFVGTDLFEKRLVKKGLSDELQKKYIANHYHHELGHGLFTQRDMKRTQEALKKIAAPFGLYNLFEDARMEARYRKDAEYAFEWLKMEDLDFNARPESVFFALIQAEGDEAIVRKALDSWSPAEPDKEASPFAALFSLMAPNPEEAKAHLLELFPKVLKYYKRTIAAANSLRVMPILKAWLDEFGRAPEMPKSGMEDLELSAKLMTNPKFAEEFEKPAKPVMVESTKAGASEGVIPAPPNEADADPSFDAIAREGKLLKDTETPVNMELAKQLAAKFEPLFKSESRYSVTSAPQKRISARHLVVAKPFYRRKDVVSKGAKNIFMEFDCSGSMSGSHLIDGKLLVSALNLLALKGRVTGHLALSGVVNGTPQWELFKFPLRQEMINRIEAYCGAEGLEYTLRNNISIARDADYVFVYTDGQICDKPIDKSYFHALGIQTWGLYSGTGEQYLESLTKYFDKAIMRSSAADLIDAILVQLK